MEERSRLEIIETIKELAEPLEVEPTGEQPRLKQIKGIKAVVFDVYGTMMLSGSGDIGLTAQDDLKADAFEKAAAQFNLREAEDMAEDAVELLQKIKLEVHEEATGRGVDKAEVVIEEIWQEVFEGLEEPGCMVSLPDQNTLLKFCAAYECRVNPTWLVPGLEKTLNTIAGQNLTLGIVSNAQFFTRYLFDAYLDKSLVEFGFQESLMVWSYLLRVAKPSLSIYTPLLFNIEKEHGIKPGEILYVGNDMLNDIYPAHALGMKTALFAGDQRSLRLREEDERCAGLEADLVITEMPQLLEVLEN